MYLRKTKHTSFKVLCIHMAFNPSKAFAYSLRFCHKKQNIIFCTVLLSFVYSSKAGGIYLVIYLSTYSLTIFDLEPIFISVSNNKDMEDFHQHFHFRYVLRLHEILNHILTASDK